MKKEFAPIDNYKRAVIATNAVVSAPPGIDKMALAFGGPGLGKTQSFIKIANDFCAHYIRVKKISTVRSLFSEIVAELGESPAWRTHDVFNQAVEILLGTDTLIILDEIDYLTSDSRVIESIRDLHDITNSPFVFIGMEHADKKLKRYRHLWRRFSQVVRFEPLGVQDVVNVMNQICEVQVDNSAIEYVFNANELTVAMLYRWAQKFEQIARSKKKSVIAINDLKKAA